MTKYTVSSNIGTSFRCGLNHVVLPQGTALVLAAEVDAAMNDARREVWEQASQAIQDALNPYGSRFHRVEHVGLWCKMQADHLKQALKELL